MRKTDDFDDIGSGGSVSGDQIKTAVRKNKWPLIAVGVIVLIVIAVVLA